MFEQEYARYLEEQRRTASGLRLEQLQKELVGEKKLLGAVLWPVFGSFNGLIMEHEVVSQSGMKIFIDAFYEPLGIAFESEGFVAHAENITRERFNFERMRVRTMALYGYKYFPFTWDELDKKPEACRRSLYELLGRYSGGQVSPLRELTVYEREVLRFVRLLNRPFRLSDVCGCLQLSKEASLKVLRQLMVLHLIRPKVQNKLRNHEYVLTEHASVY